MLRTILVPLDGSAVAETALSHAIALARPTQATIRIIRVIPAINNLTADPCRADPQTVAETEHYLRTIEARVHAVGLPVQAEWRCGYTIHQLLQYIVEVHVDLIVMSTHGRSGLRRLLLGSIAERIVREAACPVLLVHGQKPVDSYQRILVPLDGTSSGESVLPLAAELARGQQACLVLFHVVPPMVVLRAPLGPRSFLSHTTEQYNREALEQAKHYLEGVAATLHDSGLQVVSHARLGYPADAIPSYAQEIQPDLIVMATHARVPIERAFVGSVADHVLRHTQVPLVVGRYVDVPVSLEQRQEVTST